MLLDIGEFSSFQCCYASIALWFKLFLFYFKYVILTYLLILSFHFVSYFICSYSSYIPSQLTLETPPPPLCHPPPPPPPPLLYGHQLMTRLFQQYHQYHHSEILGKHKNNIIWQSYTCFFYKQHFCKQHLAEI